MISLFSGLAARFAASFLGHKVKDGIGFAAEIPQQVWEAVAVIGYALALLFLHQHYAHAALKAADQAGYDRRASEDATALKQLRKNVADADAQVQVIAARERKTNDETNVRIAADAGTLLVRGPGKAAAADCRPVRDPGVPARSGGPQSPAHAPDDAGALLPGGDGSTDRAVVPWSWLVGRTKECDLDRAEVIAWRNANVEERAAWERLRDGSKPPSQ